MTSLQVWIFRVAAPNVAIYRGMPDMLRPCSTHNVTQCQSFLPRDAL